MKRILFYTSSFPIVIFLFFADLIVWFFIRFLAGLEVLEILLARYEHWAFDVPKGTFFNCPWRKSLKQVYKEALDDM